MIATLTSPVIDSPAPVVSSEMSLQQTLRDAVKARIAAGESRHSIALQSKVAYSNLVRWLEGETVIRLDTADRLATYLGLRLYPEGHCCTDDKGRKGKR